MMAEAHLQKCPVCGRQFKSGVKGVKSHLTMKADCLFDSRAFAMDWSEDDVEYLKTALVWHKSEMEKKRPKPREESHVNDGYGDGYREGYDCGYERGLRAGRLESSTRSEVGRGEGRSSSSTSGGNAARYYPY